MLIGIVRLQLFLLYAYGALGVSLKNQIHQTTNNDTNLQHWPTKQHTDIQQFKDDKKHLEQRKLAKELKPLHLLENGEIYQAKTRHQQQIMISNTTAWQTITSKRSSFHQVESSNSLNFRNRLRRAVTAKKELIWDYGVIPYEIDKIFKPQHRTLFKQAMRHWENFTCIKFVERESKIHQNYIYFTIKNCGCCSFVGKSGKGRQDISIGRNCEKFGIVLHELGHAIGFWHEHTRADRDKHIIINSANIMKGQEHNFEVQSPEVVDSLDLPYDYNSIMHYARDTFSKSAYLDTIQPIAVRENRKVEIGQRIYLSKGDIAQANLLYKCTACGQTFQKSSGEIIAPHYQIKEKSLDEDADGNAEVYKPQDSKALETCEWRITATSGERILLHLHQVNLLETTECSSDYLEVRDGYWHRSPLLKRLCGNITALTLESISSRMLITYVNRHSLNGYLGFKAEFEVLCGNDIYLTQKIRIDSPNYPLPYYEDQECVWHIRVEENHQVVMKFEFFELENHDECIYDYLEIRDGNHSNADLLAHICGHKFPTIVRSKTNQLYIKFVTDGSVQKVGFSAILISDIDQCKFSKHGCQHECINILNGYRCACFAGYELQANGKNCSEACGGTIDITESGGVLTSPSYPDVYPILKQCTWELVAPIRHSVFLNFTHFDLEGNKFQYTECSYDYLVIYSKLPDNTLRKIGIYCGSKLPPLINSEHNILRLEFYSDKAVQHSGFSVLYQLDNNECSINNGGCQHICQNTFGSYGCSCYNGFTLDANQHNCTETSCKFEISKPYGTVTSPHYPENYPQNIYCYWRFRTVLGHRVQLTFHEFELEEHQECMYDFLAVHDGTSDNNSTLGVYCGGDVPYTVLASSNYMFVVLKTDGSIQRKGFRATYTTECGGYLRATNHTQIFYSHPRFGSRTYKRNSYCDWRIEADIESSVKIRFLHFELEYSEKCEYDFVEIFEEPSIYRNTHYGRYCGNQKPPVTTSYSDTILIRFQSDNVTSLKGFAVAFTAVQPPDDDLTDDYMFATSIAEHTSSTYYASDKEYSKFRKRKHYKAKQRIGHHFNSS